MQVKAISKDGLTLAGKRTGIFFLLSTYLYLLQLYFLGLPPTDWARSFAHRSMNLTYPLLRFTSSFFESLLPSVVYSSTYRILDLITLAVMPTLPYFLIELALRTKALRRFQDNEAGIRLVLGIVILVLFVVIIGPPFAEEMHPAKWNK
jgi:hypothetical protein